MRELTKQIDVAMKLSDEIRGKLLDMLTICDNTEGTEHIREQINMCATPLVNAHNALEDVLSAIVDYRDID